MAELVERVARVIADAFMEDYEEATNLYNAMAEAAIAEVRKAEPEGKAAEQASQNIAYLQANIREMERFAARSEENDDAIGALQWDNRIADFNRQLDEALASVPAPSA